MTTAAPTSTVEYFYDEGSSAANALGRLTRVTDGVGSETYQYNQLGQITQFTKNVGGTNFVITYVYNQAGQIKTVTYPSNRQVTQDFDSIGRVTKISSAGTDYISGVQYNAAGAATQFDYGNGVRATIRYNNRLQLQSLAYAKGTTKLLELAYGYTGHDNGGNNGQITGITDNTGTPEAGRSVTYTYDAWGRLRTALTTGSTQYPQWGLSWDYDRFGNRKNQNVTAGSGGSMQMSIDQNTNRITLIGSTSPEYDSAGNLTKDDQWQYVYDAENRIVEVKTLAGATIATYSYDWRGVRIKKVTGESTTRYVFSGLKALAEYTNGALTREYIYHGDRFLGEWASQTVHMLYGDQISPRLSADSIGTQKGEQGHFPFGETWYESGYVTKWKFTYHERDAESGLDYATFRYYSSRLGRFMTPDPLAGNIFNPQRLNRYAYVLNDPVNLTDPYGLECTGPGGIILPCPDVTSITVNGSTYSSLGAFFEGIISAKLRPRNVDGVRGGTGPGGPPEIGPPRQNPQTCVEPNVLQRAVITGLGFWAGLTGRTIGVGAGGSAGIGYVMGNAFSASRQLVVSPNGQAAFVTTVGTNAIPLGPTHGAGAFGGLQVSVSNAQNPGQLAGVSVNGGGGGGSGAGAAVDVSFGTTGTWQANATLGAGAGGYGAAGTFQVSSVTSICPPR